MMLGGQPHALGATMGDVLCLTRQCQPAVKGAVFYVSLPYGSFHVSRQQAVQNALELVRAGAHCVKAQAHGALKKHAEAIIDAGIPFIGHVGLLPHLYYKRGGFRVYGKTSREALELLQECQQLQDMGASAIEMEAVPAAVAREITNRLQIPVFGIGAGPHTDGQFQVLTDIFGLQKDFSTKFSRKYLDLWPDCIQALTQSFSDVRSGEFPAAEHCFDIDKQQLDEFLGSCPERNTSDS